MATSGSFGIESVDSDIVFADTDMIIRVTDTQAIIDITAPGAADIVVKRQK